MSANIFSSLSGSYNYVNDMSNLISDYSSIKNGSYGSLMKSYVNKVGNKAALNAYRETGSTTTAAESSTSTASSKKSTSTKSSFLDSHLSSIGKSTESSSTTSTKKSFLDSHLDSVLGTGKSETASDTKTPETAASTSAAADTATTADKYAKYKSSWLDDQLKQYDKDANKTTAADTSVAYNATV